VARAMEVLHHALKQQSMANKWEKQLKLERDAYSGFQKALKAENALESSAELYETQMKSAHLETSIAATEKQMAAEVTELALQRKAHDENVQACERNSDEAFEVQKAP